MGMDGGDVWVGLGDCEMEMEMRDGLDGLGDELVVV